MFYYLSHIFTEWWIKINKLNYEENYDNFEIEARGNIHAIVTIMVCLLCAYLINIFLESVLILLIYQITRMIIGGRHWTLGKCFFITVISTLIFAKIGSIATKNNISLLYLLLVVAFYMVGFMPYFKEQLSYINEKIMYKKYSKLMIYILTVCFICDIMNIQSVINTLAMAFLMILITSKKWF